MFAVPSFLHSRMAGLPHRPLLEPAWAGRMGLVEVRRLVKMDTEVVVDTVVGVVVRGTLV
jgi:hypothetical protein